MDDFAGRDLGLDRVEEADELLVPVALQAGADDLGRRTRRTVWWCRSACSHG